MHPYVVEEFSDAETAVLRGALSEALAEMGLNVIDGVANFLLCHLPAEGASAAEIVARCRKQNLFLRDASPMGAELGRHTLRIVVKDAAANRQMLRILRGALGVKNDPPHTPRLATIA